MTGFLSGSEAAIPSYHLTTGWKASLFLLSMMLRLRQATFPNSTHVRNKYREDDPVLATHIDVLNNVCQIY
jgi:hypothetical protein